MRTAKLLSVSHFVIKVVSQYYYKFYYTLPFYNPLPLYVIVFLGKYSSH